MCAGRNTKHSTEVYHLVTGNPKPITELRVREGEKETEAETKKSEMEALPFPKLEARQREEERGLPGWGAGTPGGCVGTQESLIFQTAGNSSGWEAESPRGNTGSSSTAQLEIPGVPFNG